MSKTKIVLCLCMAVTFCFAGCEKKPKSDRPTMKMKKQSTQETTWILLNLQYTQIK